MDIFSKLGFSGKAPKHRPSGTFEKLNDTALLHCTLITSALCRPDLRDSYDFRAKELLTVNIACGVVSPFVTPFSQIDAKILAEVREKLIEPGGHPPEAAAPRRNGPKQG
ncbi:MAG: hypothetical protein KGL10_03900 [Alphaproteobacteria bacterium]|nr:hypothetical protein [Alphaproteobacteria bacterium]